MITTTTTLQKWGNSQAVRIPKALLEEVGLGVGAELEIKADGPNITISPRRPSRRRGKYTIEELVADQPEAPADETNQEVDWGPPVGREVW